VTDGGVAPLAVVIPSFQGATRIGPTLASLGRDAPGLPVVIVDDGSDDDTAGAALRSGSGLDLRIEHHGRNRGRAAARNTGIRAAAAEWILMLDDDMEVLPGMVRAHRDAHAGAGARAFLGRHLLPDDLPAGPFAEFLRREAADRDAKLAAARDDVPWRFCLTGQMSARRADLLDAGGFDESLASYGFEDIEIGIRLRRRGTRLAYLPSARSIHRGAASDLRRLRQRTYESGRGALLLLASHGDDAEVRAYLRLDGMGTVDPRRDSGFLAAMRVLNAFLRRPRVLAWLSEGAGERALLSGVAALERLPLRRLRALAYHVARDVAYYRGVEDARRAADPAARR
jgi:GT2 family glycosyltransferase